VIAANGTIYIGTSSNVVALAPDGTVRWSVPGEADMLAIDVDGNVIAATPTAVSAIRPDGSTAWTLAEKGNNGGSEPLIAADGTIYVDGSALTAIDGGGKAKWQQPALQLDGAAVAHDGRIFGETIDGGSPVLRAVSMTGHLDWSADNLYSISAPVIADDGTVYVPGGGADLISFTPDGTRMDHGIADATALAVGPPSIGPDGTLFLVSFGSMPRLHALASPDVEDWSVPLPSGAHSTRPRVDADGVIYLGVGPPRPVDIGPQGPDHAFLDAFNPDGSAPWSLDLGIGYFGSLALGDRALYVPFETWDGTATHHMLIAVAH
jgi:outer membrane protein assembly factor BamB